MELLKLSGEKHMNLWSAAHLKEDFEKPCKRMQIEAEGTKPDERYIKLYNLLSVLRLIHSTNPLVL